MTEAAAGEPKVRRWTAQRWALDNVLRSVGIDWDHGPCLFGFCPRWLFEM